MKDVCIVHRSHVSEMRSMATMECNKDEATRVKKLAEEKMKAGDFVGAKKLVWKAQRLYPDLENKVQMITICDVHSSANKKISGLDNWYAILQVQHSADAITIKKQYRKLALLLHPDKNKFVGAEAAFKLVGEAYRLLSDQIKRSQYDIRFRYHSALAKRQSNASPGRHCAAKTDTNGVKEAKSIPDLSASKKKQAAKKKRKSVEESTKSSDVAGAKTDTNEAKEPEVGAGKSIPDLSAPQKKQTAKKKRKSVEECSDVAGANTDMKENSKRKSSRKNPQVSNAEGRSNGDFVSPLRKKKRSGCEIESDSNAKQMAEGNTSPELAESGVSPASSHADKGKAKQNVNCGNEDILPAENKESEANGEDWRISTTRAVVFFFILWLCHYHSLWD